MDHRIYRAHVSVTVPLIHEDRLIWRQAPELPDRIMEFVRSPEECGPMVQRMGSIVAVGRLRETSYLGLRVTARGVTTGALCGFAQWQRRTRAESFEHVFTWAATWSDILVPNARVTAAYDLRAAA